MRAMFAVLDLGARMIRGLKGYREEFGIYDTRNVEDVNYLCSRRKP